MHRSCYKINFAQSLISSRKRNSLPFIALTLLASEVENASLFLVLTAFERETGTLVFLYIPELKYDFYSQDSEVKHQHRQKWLWLVNI